MVIRSNWTSKTYRGLPKFLLSVQNWYQSCQKARPLLTSCSMFAPPTYWKFAKHGLSLKDVPLSTCGSFIDRHVTCHGSLLMAVWSLRVFVKLVELINWCLYNLFSSLIDVYIIELSPYSVARVQNVDSWTQKFQSGGIFQVTLYIPKCPGSRISSKT